jgi:hypothetical protein
MVRRLYDAPIALGELEQQLTRVEANHHDTFTHPRELSVADEGKLLVRGEAHRLQPKALDQLAGKLRVPASYLHRCPPDLVATNLNRWISGLRSDVLVRFDGSEVRAILSPRYQPVSNLEIVQRVLGTVPEDMPVRFELTACLFVAQVLTPEYREGGLHGGMNLTNSETGHSVVQLSALIYRTICLNGLILGDSDVALKRRHTHDAGKTLHELTGLARQAWAESSRMPGRLDGTRTIRIPDPVPVFDRIAQRYGLGQLQRRAIDRAFDVEPGGSLFEVINAVTRAANGPSLSLAERSELQEVGGRMLGLAEAGHRWL